MREVEEDSGAISVGRNLSVINVSITKIWAVCISVNIRKACCSPKHAMRGVKPQIVVD